MPTPPDPPQQPRPLAATDPGNLLSRLESLLAQSQAVVQRSYQTLSASEDAVMRAQETLVRSRQRRQGSDDQDSRA